MYRLHCTQKLLRRLNVRPQSALPESTTALGNWYATALFWKPQLALLVNEKTLLPVLCPLAPTTTLTNRFPRELSRMLLAIGLDDHTVEAEVAMMDVCTIAKTANRSVVGMLNEFSFLASDYRDDLAITDRLALSLRLAGSPCGPLAGLCPLRVLQDFLPPARR